MDVKDMVKEVHKNAVAKGFWKNENTIINRMEMCFNFSEEEIQAVKDAFKSQRLMLIVSEVAEAQEALRKGDVENYKEELADVVIRVADVAGGDRININAEIAKKIIKNRKRPAMHNKRF